MEKKRTLLWIDLCTDSGTEDKIIKRCRELFCFHKINRNDDIEKTLKPGCPTLLCVNLDYPGARERNQIARARALHPELATIITTRYHSEELALWALRLGLRDIQIKPIDENAFICLANKIFSEAACNTLTHGAHHQLPHLPSTRGNPAKNTTKITQIAVDYVEEHYPNKISIDDVAQLCHMPPRKFSYEFKREHGLTFKEFLIRYRIDMAQLILNNNQDSSITDVAMSVGFNDHSYFTRIFRRYVGVNPSSYSNNPLRE